MNQVKKINKEKVAPGVTRFQLDSYEHLCPAIEEKAWLYDFVYDIDNNDVLDNDYGDGRVAYEGRDYTAVSLNLTGDPENDDWEFLGYVDNSDLKKKI